MTDRPRFLTSEHRLHSGRAGERRESRRAGGEGPEPAKRRRRRRRSRSRRLSEQAEASERTGFRRLRRTLLPLFVLLRRGGGSRAAGLGLWLLLLGSGNGRGLDDLRRRGEGEPAELETARRGLVGAGRFRRCG